MSQEKQGVVSIGKTRCENGGSAKSVDRSGEPVSGDKRKAAKAANPDLKDIISRIQKEQL